MGSTKDNARLAQLEKDGKATNEHLFLVDNLLLEDKEPDLVPGGAIARFVVNSDYNVKYHGENKTLTQIKKEAAAKEEVKETPKAAEAPKETGVKK